MDVCEQRIEKIMAGDRDYSFDSDSYKVESRVLNEEAYLPKLSVLVIEFVNATTSPLDFKKLSSSTYERFENFSQIEEELKKEGLPLVAAISDDCDLKGLDEIIIEFVKYRESSSKPLYRFICHYPLTELQVD